MEKRKRRKLNARRERSGSHVIDLRFIFGKKVRNLARIRMNTRVRMTRNENSSHKNDKCRDGVNAKAEEGKGERGRARQSSNDILFARV